MEINEEELNQILLSKTTSDFCLAIIEKREGLLSEEEYQNIIGSEDDQYLEVSKKDFGDIYNKIKEKEQLSNYANEIMRALYSVSTIRYSALITMINDNIYDIANREFVDIKRNKIIHYENMINYYDSEMAATRLITPEQDPRLKKPTVLVDVMDITPFKEYEKTHVNQEENEDLTSAYIKDVKGNSKGLHL